MTCLCDPAKSDRACNLSYEGRLASPWRHGEHGDSRRTLVFSVKSPCPPCLRGGNGCTLIPARCPLQLRRYSSMGYGWSSRMFAELPSRNQADLLSVSFVS